MKLELVTHCWHYAPHLCYQLSSLLLWPPKHVTVTASVFYSERDQPTVNVLRFFARECAEMVYWRWRPLPDEMLFRRSIGRNIAALESTADWIWFADADMCFREGCLDQLAVSVGHSNADLVYPRSIRISANHASGDRALDLVNGSPPIIDVEPAGFVPHIYNRAISGVQIVRGTVGRFIGYDRTSRRYQMPGLHWDHSEDVAFRKSLRTTGQSVDIDGAFRGTIVKVTLESYRPRPIPSKSKYLLRSLLLPIELARKCSRASAANIS